MEAQIGAFVESQRTGVNAHLCIDNTKRIDDTITFVSGPWFEMHFPSVWIALNRCFPMHTWSLTIHPHPNGLSFSMTVTLIMMDSEQKKKLWRKVAEDHFPDYLYLFGLSEATAATVLKEKGMYFEVVKRDGKDGLEGYGNKMIDKKRVLVYVEDGKIVGIHDVGH